MSKLIEHILKAIQDDLPKALIGLLIPAGKYGWKLWQDLTASKGIGLCQRRIDSMGWWHRSGCGPPRGWLGVCGAARVRRCGGRDIMQFSPLGYEVIVEAHHG